jgi:hypothetical protein
MVRVESVKVLQEAAAREIDLRKGVVRRRVDMCLYCAARISKLPEVMD